MNAGKVKPSVFLVAVSRESVWAEHLEAFGGDRAPKIGVCGAAQELNTSDILLMQNNFLIFLLVVS